MTQQAVNNVEQRFKELKDETDSKEWNNVRSLVAIAEELEGSDIALARRVLQRAKNLAPKDKKVLLLLKRLSNDLASSAKEQMVSSSEEQSTSQSKVTLLKTFWSERVPDDVKLQLKKPLTLFVILPFIAFAFYQVVWASPGYESRAQVIVQQPDGMATMDASMALLSGLGVGSPSSNDMELVRKYIYSQDMIDYVLTKIEFLAHYSDSGVDVFSRLSSDASQEEIYRYYTKHVLVEVDEKSAIITIFVKAYDSQFAFALNKVLVERSEWYINSIGHQLAESQLSFIQKEHQVVENKMEKAKTELLNFQQHYNLLDPVAEGAAVQQIAYGLEGQIASLEAELKNLLSVMTPQAPQVEIIQTKIDAMKSQLELERKRLAVQQSADLSHTETNQQELGSVSEVLARYTEYKVALELAIQGYTSSQISLEKARIEAYRQLKYLIVVESPTAPEDNQYPEVIYNLVLFLVISMMIFGITKIVIATVKELN